MAFCFSPSAAFTTASASPFAFAAAVSAWVFVMTRTFCAAIWSLRVWTIFSTPCLNTGS
jgi:hypothetical protein